MKENRLKSQPILFIMVGNYTSDASSVMSVLRSFEIGQFSLASLAFASNLSLDIPGTFALSVSSDFVITPLSNVIVQSVESSSAVKPASCSTKLSFMVKHPACAAAINSSGLVPTPSAKRELTSIVFCLTQCFEWRGGLCHLYRSHSKRQLLFFS